MSRQSNEYQFKIWLGYLHMHPEGFVCISSKLLIMEKNSIPSFDFLFQQ